MNLSQQTTDIPKSAPFLAIRKRLMKRLPKHIIDKTEQISDDTLRKMIIEKSGKEIYDLADNIAADAKLTDEERLSLRKAFINALVLSAKTGEEPDLATALRTEFGEDTDAPSATAAAAVPAVSPAGKPLAAQAARSVSPLALCKNPKGITVQQLEQTVAQVAGFVKMMTGVANNAAISIMLHCLNKIADVRSKESYAEEPWHPHPRYKQKVKQLFNQALAEKDHYRRRLMYPGEHGVRFFRVSDMPDEARRKYGVINDKTYFEFWEGTGALAYQKSQPLIGSLWNKFRLSLQHHGVPNAEQVAWGLVGANVLELAVVVWQRAMKSAHEAFEGLLTMDYVEQLYRPFSLHCVSLKWRQALSLMAPEVSTYSLDSLEERNIEMGVQQLMELWISPDLPFDSTIKAVEDFSDDIFSTPGHAKKAMRELADMRNKAVEDLAQQMAEERKAMLAK
jgi:hypothetical protein